MEIVYKIIQYADKVLFKTSPVKKIRPGRKSIIRMKDKYYTKDVVKNIQFDSQDLSKKFESVEQMRTIQQRLTEELSCLSDSIKAVRRPQMYPVEFA
jgi:hypothetical protein